MMKAVFQLLYQYQFLSNTPIKSDNMAFTSIMKAVIMADWLNSQTPNPKHQTKRKKWPVGSSLHALRPALSSLQNKQTPNTSTPKSAFLTF